jgi:hypothetical protein
MCEYCEPPYPSHGNYWLVFDGWWYLCCIEYENESIRVATCPWCSRQLEACS